MVDVPEPGMPLSAAQSGIWLGQQLDPDNPVYNTAECIEIRGPVDPVMFERAVRQTVQEAEALHMRFVLPGDEPRQEPALSSDWTLPVVDLSGEQDPWQAAQAWMDRDLGRTIDLERGPLFAQALFRAAPDRFFWYQRIHHIAMDGFGYSLLARRVADLYSTGMEGRVCQTGAFGSLCAVVDEDLAYRSSKNFERDRDFWLERSAGWPDPVSLSHRRAPFARGFIRRTAYLPPAGLEALAAAAGQAGVQWPDALTAVTAAFLHRQTGASDIVLGLPVMGRLGTASLRVPCMVMNIVPLRLSLDPTVSLSGLMRQVAEELRRIRPHQRYRHEQIRRDWKLLNGERRLFGPVVNIMPFDYHLRFARHPAIAHNLSAGPVEDLSIGVYARSDGTGLRIDFDANPACYGPEELAGHQSRFLDFLAASTGEPDRPIARVAVSPAIGLDGGPLPVPAKPVVELISAHAQMQPDAVAVTQEDRHLTYAELVCAAGQIAARLIERGAGPDQLVAVLLPRGLDAVTAILGTLFAGAGYLPLDPDGPESRIVSILEDAAPTLVITLARFAGRVSGLEVLLLDEQAPAAEAIPPVTAGAADLAYVIYTSGSTGQPNGVMIGRDALAHFVAGATHRYGIRRDDRVLQFAPLHFDASVEEIFLTLCAGATLVLRTNDMVQSVPRFLEAVARHGVTVLDLPTAFWHELAYSISSGATILPSDVRTVIIGGEAALPEPVRRWRETVGPAVKLLNTYGPTEATIVATVATISEGDAIPIGRPLPGLRAIVIDPNGHPTALGHDGEFYLIGPALSFGYLGRPELTAKRFVTLPALPDAPRAYRTGDRVRQTADGQLLFVGRVDDEFKISGHRVAPIEIETALLRCAGIREAAVVGQVLADGAKRLSAWVVADEPRPTPSTLRRELQKVLPASVIPAEFRFIDRLPRNANGKIDRAALRDRPSEPVTEAPVEAGSPMENLVLEVWQQVLGVREPLAGADFFELGGQSLQAIQTANRLGVRLGREVPIAAVFRHPTVAALARFLEQDSRPDTNPDGLGVLLPIVSRGVRPPLFCIHPAGGLGWCYFGLAKLLPDHPIYALQARGLAQPEALPASMEEMARDYLTRIRRVQPAGPYHLLGWSIGGVVAHTLATLLQEGGEEVRLLAMLDAYPRDQWCHLNPPGEQDGLTALLNIAGHDRVAANLDRAGVLALLRHQGGPLASLDEVRLGALIDIATNNIRLLRDCRHGKFRGDILFFTAGKPRPETWLSSTAWTPYVEGCIETIDIDCTHPAMMHPASLAHIGPVLKTRLCSEFQRERAV
jgi:nonribosomal peptide synthetase MxcG